MRFVAGWGAVAELLLAGAPWQRDCREAAPWRSAIGKMLLARGAAVAEILLAGALWREAAPWQRC